MANQNDQSSPIFVHSLFRAGSTYLFQVFRRSAVGYWCYQEPIHEVAFLSRDNVQNLIRFKGEIVSHLRHPLLNESYFYELHETVECWRKIITKEIIYDDYFGRFAQNARAEYLRGLIKGAEGRGRAFIQECRTASRIASVRQDVGGMHIYLWRNPWDQWWSYKVTEYFDAINQLILNAPDHPEVVARLRQEIGFKEFHNEDIQKEIGHFSERRLSTENSYLVFYSLWCLGLLEGISSADMLLNVDALSDFPAYREVILQRLADMGILGLDFSDCSVPQARYGDQDKSFFKKIEEHVHELLLLSGLSPLQVDSLITQRQAHQPRIWNLPFNDLDVEKLINDAVRARNLLRHFETREAQSVHRLISEREGLTASVQEINFREQGTRQEVSRLSQVLSERKSELAQLESELAQMESELAQLRNATAQLEGRLSLREAEVAGMYRSLSWRLTMPLRRANLLAKSLKGLIDAVSASLARFPRRATQRVLLSALAHLQAQPTRKAKVTRLLEYFPKLDLRLRNLSRSHKQQVFNSIISDRGSPILGSKKNHADMRHLENGSASFSAPLKSGCRVVYYYVDHTILCPVNTGMQRVTRQLGRALLGQGESVRFVKWDERHQRFALLNQTELIYLSQWHGPSLSKEDLRAYPLPHDPVVFVGGHIAEQGHWLVIPEVTHITYQPRPVTMQVIMTAKRLGLKTAFIFYDAIPLRCSELAAMAQNHETYIQQLLLADLVVPISEWSARDLVSFYRTHEGATLAPTPSIKTISLPGESQLAPRVTAPSVQGNARKLILSVGSVELRKNQIALIHAFEKFCADYPDNDWQLSLVGSAHPDLVEKINLAVKRNSRISFLGHISDGELDALYRSCSFTVFPSIEEGFGLPILESLWYAKPCICADFGAMAEVAEGGGCLTINVRETDELVRAITRMTNESGLLEHLSHEAANRPIHTWADYAKRFTSLIDCESDPIHQMGVIYYWVDHTCTYPGNSGIQRVVRGLGRALVEIGLKLVPVKWDRSLNQFCALTDKELQHLAQWNGPKPSEWNNWIHPSQSSANDWLLIPELVSDPAGPDSQAIRSFASTHQLRAAWIFYDAIPWKMPEIYPPEATLAHSRYMEGLNEFERVFAISEHSRFDLTRFLAAGRRVRCPNLDDRIRACLLPGEFLEAPRATEIKPVLGTAIKILCVCTIEPRKNHLSLLQAFEQVVARATKPIELILVGTCPFPDLAKRISQYIGRIPSIRWERDASDARLRELYAECDFTVYPSIEEGFGLPILESLWNARPCICRDKSAMIEVAEGGGCLTVETANSDVLAQAILSLAEDSELRLKLAREAISRSFKTWRDYAREVATHMAKERYIPFSQLQPEPLKTLEFYNQFVNLRPRPLLSICITTYNRAEWLALSLKNLTRLIPNPRAEIEIVVCDNTSTDHTPRVVEPYLHRSDFRYYRNPENVGMLGNLRVTAHHARGQYIWVLGDDDLVKPGSIERVLQAIQTHPGIALVYLNYAYTRLDNAKAVTDLDRFLKESVPIATIGPDIAEPIHRISTKSENFFTAIYCLIFRRDHALRAYSQNTDGPPFSTMKTCIPTTYHVLNFMMNEPGYWIGDPQVVVNLNVSWMRYASIWILERLPEAHDLAEKMGANPQEVDRCRINHLPHVFHWFREIFENDQEVENVNYFSASRLVTRMKHLDEFRKKFKILRDIYNTAHTQGHVGASLPTYEVFIDFEN